MKPKLKTWMVRVYRKVEMWVEIKAETALQAEAEAGKLPLVLNVFSGSAMRGDKPVEGPAPIHPEDIEDGW
jgi:hypothetical protein